MPPSTVPSAAATPVPGAIRGQPGPDGRPDAPARPPPQLAVGCDRVHDRIGRPTLPSDRLTNVTVTPGATSDRLDFVFGDSSLPGPVSPPMGTLEIARPPYTPGGEWRPDRT